MSTKRLLEEGSYSISLIAPIVGIGVAIFVSNMISRPEQAVSNSLRLLAKGNLSISDVRPV
ncbi:hypothetical protein ACF5W4_17640 [Bacillota bacterium Lsc_1132]